MASILMHCPLRYVSDGKWLWVVAFVLKVTRQENIIRRNFMEMVVLKKEWLVCKSFLLVNSPQSILCCCYSGGYFLMHIYACSALVQSVATTPVTLCLWAIVLWQECVEDMLISKAEIWETFYHCYKMLSLRNYKATNLSALL